MSESSKSKSVTLKRSVTIKAIVTDPFKQYMQFEIQQNIFSSNQKLEGIDKGLAEIQQRPDFSQNQGSQLLKQQLEAERIQTQYAIQELSQRLKAIETLQLGSEFTQGIIDGFVSVSEGDNLYEKIGGLEIQIKDGIVQKIAPLSKKA